MLSTTTASSAGSTDWELHPGYDGLQRHYGVTPAVKAFDYCGSDCIQNHWHMALGGVHNVNVITCPHVSFLGHTDIYGRQKLENIAMTLFTHKLTPEEIAKIKLLETRRKRRHITPRLDR